MEGEKFIIFLVLSFRITYSLCVTVPHSRSYILNKKKTEHTGVTRYPSGEFYENDRKLRP